MRKTWNDSSIRMPSAYNVKKKMSEYDNLHLILKLFSLIIIVIIFKQILHANKFLWEPLYYMNLKGTKNRTDPRYFINVSEIHFAFRMNCVAWRYFKLPKTRPGLKSKNDSSCICVYILNTFSKIMYWLQINSDNFDWFIKIYFAVDLRSAYLNAILVYKKCQKQSRWQTF